MCAVCLSISIKPGRSRQKQISRRNDKRPTATAGAVLGAICGLSSWFSYAKIAYGEVTIDTTGMNPPLLAGNVFALGISLIVTVAGSLLFPSKKTFDWEELNKITKIEDSVRPHSHTSLLIESEQLAWKFRPVAKFDHRHETDQCQLPGIL